MSNTVSMQFPDGSVREYDASMTGAGLAESISKSLAKKLLPMPSMAPCAIFPILSALPARLRF